MTDRKMIYLDDAIEAVVKESQMEGAYGYMDTKSIVDLLRDLPSAQPERKTGRWTKIHWKAFRCSECNRLSEFCTDFCPNCGADMRGEQG